ncbi:MAG: fatty acid desaturase [Betaproteobacteria bacterium]
MSNTDHFETRKRALIDRHARSNNLQAGLYVATTLLPLAALWVGITILNPVSLWYTAALVALMSLWTLRAFVIMHECGHGSLFRSARLNRFFGFIFGVVTGMPQFVWSQHHQFHHATNGNWAKYQGPLSITTAEKYAAMNPQQQQHYCSRRSIWMAVHAGLFYLLLTPRFIWIRGSLQLIAHVIRRKRAAPSLSLKEAAADFKTGYWASAREYSHMAWTSIVMFVLWGVMAWLIGPLLFFVCYVAAISIGGAGGILIFTVQHNFEHAYATGDEGWSYNDAALKGTSFLDLPGWLNWFTANIAYHHVHHLSARIPAYRLAACHHENATLFEEVKRIRLSGVPHAMKYILWDTAAGRLISVAEFEAQTASTAA